MTIHQSKESDIISQNDCHEHFEELDKSLTLTLDHIECTLFFFQSEHISKLAAEQQSAATERKRKAAESGGGGGAGGAAAKKSKKSKEPQQGNNQRQQPLVID